MNLDVESLDQFLLIGAAVLLAAILAVRLAVGVGLPSLLLYLGMGVALGEAGLGIQFEDAEVAQALGFAALVIILIEGGLTTNWRELRPTMRLGASLATVGIAVSVAIVAVTAHYVFGMPWQLAVLLGAVTSSTDAAAVFSVLRRIPLPRRLVGALEAESGLNDAPVVVLVTLVSSGTALEYGVAGFAGMVLYELVSGLLIGLAIGSAGVWVLRRAALPSSGLYPLAVMSFATLAYAGGASVHASGFAAVYVAALLLGNSELPHRATTRSFAEGTAWLAQIGLFVMLGLLVSPAALTWRGALIAVVVGLLLTFVARPISVFVAAALQPLPPRQLLFISWAGLRGAVPIVLATIPLAAEVPGSFALFHVVFVLVVLTTLFTAPTLGPAAKLLRVARRGEPRDLEMEAAPLEKIAADLLQVTISPRSRLHGVEVSELRFPKGASVALIVRDGTSFTPSGRTALRHHDELLVVTPRRSRVATEERLRAVSKGGRLARWLDPDNPGRSTR